MNSRERGTFLRLVISAPVLYACNGGHSASKPMGSVSLPSVSSPNQAVAPSAVKEALHKLGDEALAYARAYDVDHAKAKLLEAQALAPDDPGVKDMLKAVEEMGAKLVAGRWLKTVEKDPMTDKENVFVKVAASSDLPGRNKRPTLEARCVKGEPALVVDADVVMGGTTFDKPKMQYRFDSDAPQSTRVDPSEDSRAIFFQTPARWFDQLIAHASGKLVVELPLFGRIPEAATFELTGADVAIGAVKTACTK